MKAWQLWASALALAFSAHAGAYVVGKPGNEYQITLRNRAREDLLAVVSVDGVNVISGETAHPLQSGYVLGAGRSLDILGWRKSLAQTAAFYFTSLADSYAARTGRPDDVGVIGVALYTRKPYEPLPIGESAPSPQVRREADSARIGTGHGRRETSQAQYVPFERASDAPAEIITLRYVPIARRERPFPGFVPDPQVWQPAHPMGG